MKREGWLTEYVDNNDQLVVVHPHVHEDNSVDYAIELFGQTIELDVASLEEAYAIKEEIEKQIKAWLAHLLERFMDDMNSAARVAVFRHLHDREQ